MYKIYINETPLILSTTEEKDRFGEAGEWRLLAPYPGKPKFLYHYIDLLEKNDRYEWVVLYHRDIARLWADFKGQFRCIEAAGGWSKHPMEKCCSSSGEGIGISPRERSIRAKRSRKQPCGKWPKRPDWPGCNSAIRSAKPIICTAKRRRVGY